METQNGVHRVNGRDVTRIGQSHGQDTFNPKQRDHLKLTGEVLGNKIQDTALYGVVAYFHVR